MFLRWLWRRTAKSHLNIHEWAERRFGDDGLRLNQKILSTFKLAIVDDKPDDFPVDYLRQCGYDLTVIEKISLANTVDLLRYDLIAMDITNVVVEDEAKGGLELIRRVKASPNPPIVIAVSGKRYDPTVTEFFKLSDYQMKKPVTAANLESAIVKLLTERWAPGSIAASMDKIISSAIGDDDKRRRCIKKICKGLEKSKVIHGVLDGNSAKSMEKSAEWLIKSSKYYDVK